MADIATAFVRQSWLYPQESKKVNARVAVEQGAQKGKNRFPRPPRNDSLEAGNDSFGSGKRDSMVFEVWTGESEISSLEGLLAWLGDGSMLGKSTKGWWPPEIGGVPGGLTATLALFWS